MGSVSFWVAARSPEEELASSAWLRGLGLDAEAPAESAWERRPLQPPTGDLPPPVTFSVEDVLKRVRRTNRSSAGGALGLELQDNAGVVLRCRHPCRTADCRTADRTVQSHRGGPSPSDDRAASDCRLRCGHPQTRRRRASPSGCGKHPFAVCWNPRSDSEIGGDLGFLS